MSTQGEERLSQDEGATKKTMQQEELTEELNFEAVTPVSKRLVEKAMRGNRGAIDKVIDMHYQDILYFAIKKVGRQEGEDVAQQAITDIIDSLEKLKDPSKLKPWMMSITHHKCMDYMAQDKKTTTIIAADSDLEDEVVEIIQDETTDFLPEKVLMDIEQHDLVLEIIDTLPENYADALCLHYHSDLSYKEVAEVLDVSEKKVKNDMYRGLALFKKRYEEQTGKKYNYSIAAIAAAPVFTQIFNEEAAAIISPEMASRVLVAAHGCAAGKAASQGSNLMNALSSTKVIAGGIAAVAVVGATALYVVNPGPTEEAPLPESIEQSIISEQVQKEIPITSVAEMIGEEEAVQLAAFETGQIDIEAWTAFLARIGAQRERMGEAADYSYNAYMLEKQDKQLFLADKINNQGEVEVRYLFRAVEEPPLMAEVMLMFE